MSVPATGKSRSSNASPVKVKKEPGGASSPAKPTPGRRAARCAGRASAPPPRPRSPAADDAVIDLDAEDEPAKPKAKPKPKPPRPTSPASGAAPPQKRAGAARSAARASSPPPRPRSPNADEFIDLDAEDGEEPYNVWSAFNHSDLYKLNWYLLHAGQVNDEDVALLVDALYQAADGLHWHVAEFGGTVYPSNFRSFIVRLNTLFEFLGAIPAQWQIWQVPEDPQTRMLEADGFQIPDAPAPRLFPTHAPALSLATLFRDHLVLYARSTNNVKCRPAARARTVPLPFAREPVKSGKGAASAAKMTPPARAKATAPVLSKRTASAVAQDAAAEDGDLEGGGGEEGGDGEEAKSPARKRRRTSGMADADAAPDLKDPEIKSVVQPRRHQAAFGPANLPKKPETRKTATPPPTASSSRHRVQPHRSAKSTQEDTAAGDEEGDARASPPPAGSHLASISRPNQPAGSKATALDAVSEDDLAKQIAKLLKAKPSKKSSDEFQPDRGMQIDLGLGDQNPMLFAVAKSRKTKEEFFSYLRPNRTVRKMDRDAKDGYVGVKLIDAGPLMEVDLDDQVLPRTRCLLCILSRTVCVPIGYGQGCLTCSQLNFPACDHRLDIESLVALHQQMSKNYAVASDATEPIIGEFTGSYSRFKLAGAAFSAAAEDLTKRHADFVDHINLCLEHIGPDNLYSRFDRAYNEAGQRQDDALRAHVQGLASELRRRFPGVEEDDSDSDSDSSSSVDADVPAPKVPGKGKEKA